MNNFTIKSFDNVVKRHFFGCLNNILKRQILLILTFLFVGLYSINAQQPAADLDQLRNGSAASPNDPGQWVNGNLGSQNSHYSEGFSAAYRAIMTNMPASTIVTLTLEYDVKHSDRHALDYLTHYDRIEPHLLSYGHTKEEIDPTIGTSFTENIGFSTFTIPVPPVLNSPVASQPVDSYNDLPGAEKLMTIWNGTITNISYGPTADLSQSNEPQQIIVTFTTGSAGEVLLAWGGHIASRHDWGSDGGGVPRSAGGISGSPYHMRLIDWNLNNLGNQDRSLSADAISAPPECESSGAELVCADEENVYSVIATGATNPTYTWEILNNTSGATFVNPPAPTDTNVTVNSGNNGGTYIVKVTVNADEGTVFCQVEVTVNKPTVTFTAPADLCVDAGVQAGLGGGSPQGGVYSGAGVTDDGNGMTYSFDPAVAGVGTHTITYTYSDNNGCGGSASDDVKVNELPELSCPENSESCIDDSPFELSGAVPEGGTYTGTGVTDGTFDPSVAGLGTHTITYTYSDGNGCTNSCLFDITVNPLPEVDIEEVDPLCEDDEAIQLIGSPIGGTWSGNGVDENGMFNPATAGVGDHVITYSYTDGGGEQDCDALLLTGIFDGGLSGGTPKGVELYVLHDIVDLSIYGLGSANNGGGTDGEEFTFPAEAVTEGTYIYVTTNPDEFNAWFGFPATYNGGNATNINGDDAIELFKNGNVIDIFGDINVDGTGQAWEHLDGWAYRNASTGPDGSTFVLGNWTFSGVNVHDGLSSNAEVDPSMPIGTYNSEVCTDCSGGEGTGCSNSDEITITVGALPTIEVTDIVCDEKENFGTYSVNILTNEGVVTSDFGTVVNINEVTWSIIDVPNGQNVTITTTTSLGCMASVEVEAPDCYCIELYYEYTDVTCYGLDDGTITVTQVSEGATVTINGEPYNPDMLYAPGSYIIKAFYEGVDIDECIFEEKINIEEPDLVDIDAVGTDVTCYGANDGTITVSNLSEGAIYTIKKNGLGPDLSGQSYFGPGMYLVKAYLPENGPSSGGGQSPSFSYDPCESIVIVHISQPNMLACKIYSGFGTNVECKTTSPNNWLGVKTTGQGNLTYSWEIDAKGLNNGWGIVENNPEGYINLVIGSGSATYTVTIEDENGCTTTCSRTVVSLCEKENNTLNFALYPNPVKDILNIKFDKKVDSDVTIEVYNLVGTKMFANTFNSRGKHSADEGMKIDFSRFPSHVYYVKVITKKGTTIKKVVLDK